MKLYFTSGTEKWIGAAKQTLKKLTRLRQDLNLDTLKNYSRPEDGVLVQVVSSVYGDWIRILGGAIVDFLVARSVDDPTRPDIEDELWALERPGVGQPYEPVLKREMDFNNNVETVRRDKDHIGSVTGKIGSFDSFGMVRGKGVSPKDNKTPSHSPDRDLSVTLTAVNTDTLEIALHDGDTDTPVEFDISGFNTRAKEVFPEPLWAHFGQPIHTSIVSPSSFFIIRRVEHNFPAPFETKDRSVYAEKWSFTRNENGEFAFVVDDTIAITDEYITNFGNEPNPSNIGELFYIDTSIGRTLFFRTQFGQKEWARYTFSFDALNDSGYAELQPVPRPFNTMFFGSAAVHNFGVPRTISFHGHLIHNEVTPRGYPYIANVWPRPIRIEDDQYWWVNYGTIISTELLVETALNVFEWQLTSPHEYRYKRLLIKNGVAIDSATDSRLYTASSQTLDGEVIPDTWDSTEPVFIYIPFDGVRINGVDWFCGYRVEEIFESTLGAARRYKFRPAVWKFDLSDIHTYGDFEVLYDGELGSLSQRNQENLAPLTDLYFAKYKTNQFFVFIHQSDAYGVGMDAPDEDPVKIAEDPIVTRGGQMVQNL